MDQQGLTHSLEMEAVLELGVSSLIVFSDFLYTAVVERFTETLACCCRGLVR